MGFKILPPAEWCIFPGMESKIWISSFVLPEKIGIGDDFCGRSAKMLGKPMALQFRLSSRAWRGAAKATEASNFMGLPKNGRKLQFMVMVNE